MTTEEPSSGQSMLGRVSNELVQSQKRFWGKGPLSAKSYMFDDMLFVVMHGGLTTAEETMLDFGHMDLVRQYRQTFENEMAERLGDAIGEITGRKVIGQQSQIMFHPHRVIELFIFETPEGEAPRAATIDGQESEGAVGESTAGDEADPEAPGEQ